MDHRTVPSGSATPYPGTEHSSAAALLARRDRIRAIQQARRRARRRMVASFGTLAVVAVVAVVWSLAGSGGGPATGGGPAPKGSTAAVQYALPRLSAMVALPDPPSGALPPIPFPAKGEGAVALMGTGTVAASKNEREVPIASVTKVMTAYLTLLAHPLRHNEQGPLLRFTSADHQAWITDSEHNDSSVELVKGERLSERQMLEALLIPSADNIADILGRWVAGSDKRFVTEMNATAASLGMHHTHYADASGVDPKSVSTAADQALLASVAMENPVLRSIVALQDVAFPVMGHIWNYNPVLGSEGIVGVKSGFTQAAAGCLVTAAWRKVGDRQVLVVSAALGQPLGLWQAGQADIAMLKAASRRLQLVSPFGSTTALAKVTVPWSHHVVSASIASPVRLPGWAGLRFSARLTGALVTQSNIEHGWPEGALVGHLQVSSQFGPVASYALRLDRPIAAPPSGSVVLRSPVSLGVGH